MSAEPDYPNLPWGHLDIAQRVRNATTLLRLRPALTEADVRLIGQMARQLVGNEANKHFLAFYLNGVEVPLPDDPDDAQEFMEAVVAEQLRDSNASKWKLPLIAEVENLDTGAVTPVGVVTVSTMDWADARSAELQIWIIDQGKGYGRLATVGAAIFLFDVAKGSYFYWVTRVENDDSARTILNLSGDKSDAGLARDREVVRGPVDHDELANRQDGPVPTENDVYSVRKKRFELLRPLFSADMIYEIPLPDGARHGIGVKATSDDRPFAVEYEATEPELLPPSYLETNVTVKSLWLEAARDFRSAVDMFGRMSLQSPGVAVAGDDGPELAALLRDASGPGAIEGILSALQSCSTAGTTLVAISDDGEPLGIARVDLGNGALTEPSVRFSLPEGPRTRHEDNMIAAAEKLLTQPHGRRRLRDEAYSVDPSTATNHFLPCFNLVDAEFADIAASDAKARQGAGRRFVVAYSATEKLITGRSVELLKLRAVARGPVTHVAVQHRLLVTDDNPVLRMRFLAVSPNVPESLVPKVQEALTSAARDIAHGHDAVEALNFGGHAVRAKPSASIAL